MRLLFLADTHHNIKYEKINELLQNQKYDVVISLGDVEATLLRYIGTITTDQHVPFLAIQGNHDNRQLLNKIPHVRNLHMNSVCIDNFLVSGFEGAWKYDKEDINSVTYSHPESIRLLRKLSKCDILISHDSLHFSFREKMSSRYMLEHLVKMGLFSLHHPGLYGITEYLRQKHPKYHFHGHHHLNMAYRFGSTKCFCIHGFALFDTETEVITTLT